MKHAYKEFILDTEKATLLFTDTEMGRDTNFYMAGRGLFFSTIQETNKKEKMGEVLMPADMFNRAQALGCLTPEIVELCDLRNPE